MKITTNRLANCQLEVTVEPDPQQVEEALRRASRQVSQRYNIPGFRKGKAPHSAVVRAVGRDVLLEQAAEAMGETVYKQALVELQLQPVAPGALQHIALDPLSFQFILALPPEVDLGDYRSVRVERPAIVVSEEDLQAQLEAMRKAQSEWAPVEDGGAQYGDMVTMKIIGVSDEQAILDEEVFELVLEDQDEAFPPGFDQQFLGQQAGASLSFDLTYPDDWTSDRAGQQVHFEAEIEAVKRFYAPSLDDAFAALYGDYATLDQLKDQVRADMIAQRQEQLADDYAGQALQAFIDNAAHFEYPSALVEAHADLVRQDQEHRMNQAGLPLNEFLRITGQSEAEFREQMQTIAETQLRHELLLDKLQELEGIQPTEEEVSQYIAAVLAVGGEEARSVRNLLKSADGRALIASNLARRQTIERMIQIADGTAPPLQERAQAGESSAQADVQPEAPAETQPAAAPEAESTAQDQMDDMTSQE